ncbi:MAG: DUF4013 domain-containing protein [Methanoregula sp.]|jgi:hypothetical protein|nr:DUF4013 domain-containing protein [Methanoregula sp.]
MDIGALLSDSFAYAQEALVGNWTRWAIFILFALPVSLVQFTFDPKTIMTGTEMNWGAIPWGQIAVLAGLGFILSFFISGYTVRIYRGTKPAPDFTGWTDLFVDGVKLAIVWLLWILPIILVLVTIGALAFLSFFSGQSATMPNITLLFIALLLLLVVFVLFVVVLLFGILGAVRFARTGSIREGIRFSAILTTIRAIGWLSYIILLIGFVIALVIYAIITGILSFIPYIGWILVLIVNPVFTIFTARYFSLVYDQGEPHQVPPAQGE